MKKFPQQRARDKRVYSYCTSSSKLYSTNTSTEHLSSCQIDSNLLAYGSSWVELPEGDLFFTGGHIRYRALNAVWVAKPLHDFAILTKSPMFCNRSLHSLTHYNRFVYAISGVNVGITERFNLATGNWTKLPEIPKIVFNHTTVVPPKTESLYVLGGIDALIQVLSLVSMKWKVVPVSLPYIDDSIPCFIINGKENKVWFISKSKVFNYDTVSCSVEHIRDLTENRKSWYGPSFYANGKLFCPNDDGYARVLKLDL